MNLGFSLKIRPKWAENKPGWHHAPNSLSQISDFNLSVGPIVNKNVLKINYV